MTWIGIGKIFFRCGSSGPQIVLSEGGTVATIRSNYNGDLYETILEYPDVTTFILPAKEIKISDLYEGNTDNLITIIGAGVDQTILTGWDFELNQANYSRTRKTFANIRYEDLTIRNRLFNHTDYIDLTGKKFELVNVKHEITTGDYQDWESCFLVATGLEINISNYELIGNDRAYAGIWFERGEVTIDGCDISGFDKPFAIRGVETLNINDVNTLGGVTGLFFGANKIRPLDGFVVENCTADGASEECILFDTYGDNVAYNATVAELSVNSASIVGGHLKMYCDSRTIEGVHPDEYYQAYSFTGNEDYLERFYVLFSQLAGSGFAGQVAKILEVGNDGNDYIIVDISTDPATLTLEDYKSVSITGGFFNGTIRNNTTLNGTLRGFALYGSFYNNEVYGNQSTDCVNGSYLFKAVMLSLGVYNGANGNNIHDNDFDDGFAFITYGTINGYNNTYIDNTGDCEIPTDEVGLVTDLLIRDGNTVAWYISSDLTTITKDASNFVSQWNDSLGSGHDLIQATEASRPKWSSDGILFDGVDDFLKTANFTYNQPETIYLVIYTYVWNTNLRIIDGNAASYGSMYQITASPTIKLNAALGACDNTNCTLTGFHILRIKFNGANGSLQVDETAATTGNVGTRNMGGITLGAAGDATNKSFIAVKEAIFRQNDDDTTTVYDYLDAKYPDRLKPAHIVFTFDDGYAENYSIVRPILQSKGINVTFFVPLDNVGTVGKNTWAELNTLEDDGNEIGSHGKTHTEFTTLSEVQLRAELDAVDAGFVANGLLVPSTVAYPYGSNNASVKTICKDYYSGARIANSTGSQVFFYSDKFVVGVRALTADVALATAQGYIDTAVAANHSVVFMAHKVVESGAAGDEINASLLDDLIDYAVASGLTVSTFKEFIESTHNKF